MQTVHSAAPRPNPSAALSEDPAPPTVAKTALKWAGVALDPRHSARLVGRTGAALAALALQLPKAAATSAPPCWSYKNFQSPAPNPEQFAIRAGCTAVHKYEQDFINQCGAQPSNGDNPIFWHSVKNWVGVAQLYSHSHDPQPSNASFIPCLIAVGGVESKHQAKIAGIVVGSVLGGLAVLLGGAFGIAYCCKRRKAAKEPADVEMGHPVPFPALPGMPHAVPAPAVN